MMKTLVDREDLVFNPPELGCVLSLSGLPGGSSKIYDRSPYGKVGSITGATWVRLPSGLWCQNFDGLDDTLTIPSVDFSGISSTTIMFWLYLTTAPTNWEAAGEYCSASNHRIAFPFIDGKLGIYYWDDPALNDVWTDSGLSTETWYLVSLLMGSGGMKIYLNTSVQSDTDPTTKCYHSLADNDAPFYWGYNYYGNYLACRLSLLRIYSYPLSAIEIQNHFNQEKHLFGA